MKLLCYIVVDVVTHISKLKGVAEMINKTVRIKRACVGYKFYDYLAIHTA